MPLFDFICQKCKLTTEELTKSDVGTINCPGCGKLATKEVSSPRGIVVDSRYSKIKVH